MSEKEQDISKDVTRRQFLNYTLMGVGGFMAAGMIAPMARFAIDPLLRPKQQGQMVQVADVSKLTNEPQRFQFSVHRVDGWHPFDEVILAYIFKQSDGSIMALSPICTHLGCTVGWNSDPAYPNQFHCPCHGGRYTKTGINIPGTPPPLPLQVFDLQVKSGKVYLGNSHQRGGTNA